MSNSMSMERWLQIRRSLNWKLVQKGREISRALKHKLFHKRNGLVISFTSAIFLNLESLYIFY